VAGTAEQQQLTEVLLEGVRRAGFSSAGELDRIERLISTPEELEDYVGILLEKVEATRFPDHHLLDRLERLLRVLRRAEQEGQRAR
jgi:hypothetical protein